MIFEIIGDQHSHAACAEDFRAPEEIAAVNLSASGQQIAHRQFHQTEDGFVRDGGLLLKLHQGGLEHVEVYVGDRTKTAAFNQHRLVMQHVGWLQDFTIRAEHGGAAQSQLHELQRHEAVVDVAKFDSAELKHVDLDSPCGEIIEQRFDELFCDVAKEKRAVAKIHAADAEGFLLG